MSAIETLLRQSIGLDAASIGSSTIQRTVRLRMKSLGIKRAEEYLQLLRTSPKEWTELVESVVVTETWFFRDQAPFAALVQLVQHEWLNSQLVAPLRLLSLPCSSGEEPYSLAMALLEAGVPAERFHIDALDISGRALAKAQRAVYGRNSFRGRDLGYRDRWFQHASEGFALAPVVRRCVRFIQANLLDAQFLADQPPYDFIFCRNLLIYFDALTRRNALEKVQRLLSPAGVLFVGAAEQPLVLDHGFVSANLPLAFACRKIEAATTRVRPQHPARALRVTPRTVRPAGTGGSQRSTQVGVAAEHPPLTLTLVPKEKEKANALNGRPIASPAAPATRNPRRWGEAPSPTGDLGLAHARRLADAGQLKEAAAVCEAHLQQQRDSAAGWYLLGLVHEAAGDPAAGECYRKALYLEPNHYESLLQMALLAEKNGDAARARTYKRRAQRSQNSAPSTST